MAGDAGPTDGPILRAVREYGLWLSGSMESTGIVLESLRVGGQALQCKEHPYPLGTTYGERHGILSPYGAQTEWNRRKRDLPEALTRNGVRTTGGTLAGHDYCGVRNPLR